MDSTTITSIRPDMLGSLKCLRCHLAYKTFHTTFFNKKVMHNLAIIAFTTTNFLPISYVIHAFWLGLPPTNKINLAETFTYFLEILYLGGDWFLAIICQAKLWHFGMWLVLVTL
jgi:hypothetical protein